MDALNHAWNDTTRDNFIQAMKAAIRKERAKNVGIAATVAAAFMGLAALFLR